MSALDYKIHFALYKESSVYWPISDSLMRRGTQEIMSKECANAIKAQKGVSLTHSSLSSGNNQKGSATNSGCPDNHRE